MNEGVLRKMDTALQNELARLGRRSRNGRGALGVHRIARQLAGMKKRSSTWLSRARLWEPRRPRPMPWTSIR